MTHIAQLLSLNGGLTNIDGGNMCMAREKIELVSLNGDSINTGAAHVWVAECAHLTRWRFNKHGRRTHVGSGVRGGSHKYISAAILPHQSEVAFMRNGAATL